MKSLYVLLLVLTAGIGHAESLRPADFAEGLILRPDRPGPIYRIELPEAVYRGITRPDAADIRVFNADGEPVSHALIPPEPPSPSDLDPVPLPVFPVNRLEEESSDGGIQFQFRTQSSGALVRIETAAPADRGPAGTYLVDAGALDPKAGLAGLEIDWSGGGEGFVISVRVAGSHDLSDWDVLVENATLAEMRYDGHQLSRHRVPLPETIFYPYLRLTWPSGTARITSVRAVFDPGQGEADRRWTTSTARIPEDADGVVSYQTGGYFPVDRLRLRPERSNSLIEGTIRSRPAGDRPWRVRWKGIVYRLETGDGETVLESEPIAIPTTTDRFFELETDSKTLPGGPPTLTVGWRPHRLVFLAEGEPPFTLAFGSGRAGAPDRTLPRLLGAIEGAVTPTPITEFEPVTLGGPAARQPPPQPFPWKTWLLWGVLIGGVALLGLMAWRLYRSLPPDGESGGGDGEHSA